MSETTTKRERATLLLGGMFFMIVGLAVSIAGTGMYVLYGHTYWTFTGDTAFGAILALFGVMVFIIGLSKE